MAKDNGEDASSVRPENVTLGDVSAMLNTFIRANYNNESLVHLGYSFKVLYSMEILGHLLDSLQDGLVENWVQITLQHFYQRDSLAKVSRPHERRFLLTIHGTHSQQRFGIGNRVYPIPNIEKVVPLDSTSFS